MMAKETQTATPTAVSPGARPPTSGSGLIPYRLTVRQVYGPDEEVPLILEGRELGRIKVSEVLA